MKILVSWLRAFVDIPVPVRELASDLNLLGFEVASIKGLKCPTAVSIAHVSEAELRDAIFEVNESDVDAIVQCGTNLCMTTLADEAERWLDKPVIAINAATWWMALRDNGIEDRVPGFGTLLREH